MSGKGRRIVIFTVLLALVLSSVAGCGGKGKEPEPEEVQATIPAQSSEPTAQVTEPTTEPAGEPASSKGSSGGTPEERVSEALGLLMGLGNDDISVFESFHFEVKESRPTWDEDAGAIITENDAIVADVQGKNVHVSFTDTNGEVTEGYIFSEGEEEKVYEVVDGQVEEKSFSMLGLAWAMWMLRPGIMLPLSSLGAVADGSDTVAGRTAERYTVDLSRADAETLGAWASFMMGSEEDPDSKLPEITGKVWVDKDTGALLKAAIDYEEDVDDDSGDKVVGRGEGRFELEVSGVNGTTVSLP